MNDPSIYGAVNTDRIQYIAIAGSIGLLLLILELIRRKKLKEEYSLLWLFFGLVFLFFSVFREALDRLSNLTGIAYSPAALFLILLMAVFFILIQFSVIISRLSDQNKKLGQEVGILKSEMKQLREKMADDKSGVKK
jgi:hypothetical protein